MVDGEHELLAVLYVRWRVVVVWLESDRVEVGPKLGSIQATDGSVPSAASSRKLGALTSILISSLVFQFRLDLLKKANLWWWLSR